MFRFLSTEKLKHHHPPGMHITNMCMLYPKNDLLNNVLPYTPYTPYTSGHSRTLEKCRKHSPAAPVFYISFVFSNARRVLSRCNTRLTLLYLLNMTQVKSIKSIFYFTIKEKAAGALIGSQPFFLTSCCSITLSC